MIVFADILGMLAKSGWSSYRIRREKALSESTITRIRNRETLTTTTIDKICRLCNCQPGDLMSYIPDQQGE